MRHVICTQRVWNHMLQSVLKVAHNSHPVRGPCTKNKHRVSCVLRQSTLAAMACSQRCLLRRRKHLDESWCAPSGAVVPDLVALHAICDIDTGSVQHHTKPSRDRTRRSSDGQRHPSHWFKGMSFCVAALLSCAKDLARFFLYACVLWTRLVSTVPSIKYLMT